MALRLFEGDFEGAADGVPGADGFAFAAPVTLYLGYQGKHLSHHHQAALIADGDAEAAAVTKFQIDYRFLGQTMSSVIKA